MDHIEIRFTVPSEELKDILTALLSNAGYDGFEEEKDLLKAFISNDEFDEKIVKEISASFQVEYSQGIIKEKNWNEVWESNFQPVQVDDFCLIRAEFHQPVEKIKHEIIITPKMSFGTGHHATTFMMIQQMQDLDFTNKNVLDFGTGTGVLAILASQLGAKNTLAIDNDDWSIENAGENISRNKIKNISLLKADHASTGQVFDIILANITRNVILDNFNYFIDQLIHDGILLLSGLLENDELSILNKAHEYHLRLKKKISRKGWISLSFIK